MITVTMEKRGRKVTGEEALASARRLINSCFNQEPGARVSIPADVNDDDLVVTDFIHETIDYINKLEEFMTNYPVHWGVKG